MRGILKHSFGFTYDFRLKVRICVMRSMLADEIQREDN